MYTSGFSILVEIGDHVVKELGHCGPLTFLQADFVKELADSVQAYDLQDIMLVAETVQSNIKFLVGLALSSVALALQHAAFQAAQEVVSYCGEENFA